MPLTTGGTARALPLSVSLIVGMALSRAHRNVIIKINLAVPTVLSIRVMLVLGHHLSALSRPSAETRLLMGPKCAIMANYLAASHASKSTLVTIVLATLRYVSQNAETPSELLSNNAIMVVTKMAVKIVKSTKNTTASAILVKHQPAF